MLLGSRSAGPERVGFEVSEGFRDFTRITFTEDKTNMKNRLLRFLSIAVVFTLALCLSITSTVVLKRTIEAQSQGAVLSRAVGVYNSQAYSNWGMYILSGNTATGSQTITVCPAIYALQDGRAIQPLSGANGVFPPVTVEIGRAHV